MSPRLRWLPLTWAVLLALLLLWPALGPGLVLSHDMVWVHDLAVHPEVLGVGSGLPRAVPSDAVVAVLDELVPGAWLQKLVLVGALVGAGAGAARLAPQESLVGPLVAVTVAEWSPFVAERLVLGHWPVLLGYAAVPWLVVACRRVRAEGRLTGHVCWLLLLGSLSASAGVVSAVVVLALGCRRGWRTTAALVAAVAAANAPWLVTGVLHTAAATSDPAGAAAFALHGEGSVPGPLAALTLGGVWNAEVVPGSRRGAAGWLVLVVLAGLAVAGWRGWTASAPRRERTGLPVCWAVGWGLALLTWAAPGPVGALAAHVPGGGLVRDGARSLALCLPVLVALTSHGATTLVAQVRRRLPVPAAVAAGTAIVLAPVALMPDAAGGVAGRLEAVRYPASYDQVRSAVDLALRHGHGDALVLPFSSYRAPRWNGRRPVLDPMSRVLDVDTVTDDRLLVSGRLLAGEDPRGAAVRRALAGPGPEARAAALARAGVAVVVEERDTGQRLPAVAGRVVLDVPAARVLRLVGAAPRHVPAGWWLAAGAAWLAFLGLLTTALGRTAATLAREVPRRRPSAATIAAGEGK